MSFIYLFFYYNFYYIWLFFFSFLFLCVPLKEQKGKFCVSKKDYTLEGIQSKMATTANCNNFTLDDKTLAWKVGDIESIRDHQAFSKMMLTRCTTLDSQRRAVLRRKQKQKLAAWWVWSCVFLCCVIPCLYSASRVGLWQVSRSVWFAVICSV